MDLAELYGRLGIKRNYTIHSGGGCKYKVIFHQKYRFWKSCKNRETKKLF